ncbi:MAG: nucleotidyltransferase family protein [Paludibacteraceae bacterium]|nr:nucleotidyltransferase family protein [Paludibacteraceae bacterium]
MTANTRNRVIPLIQRYLSSQPVKKAWLFGSYARGEETAQSDVDLLVELDYTKPIGLKYFGMKSDLEDLVGRPVDLVEESGLASYARPYVNDDKILLYERAY